MGFIIFTIVLIVIIKAIHAYKNYDTRYHTNRCPEPEVEETDIVFAGSELGLTDLQVHTILSKRNHYYTHLDQKLKTHFLKRVRAFMNGKIFIIKSNKGYKDMPVLISGTAVQLCFGLPDFLLPFYKYIRIYPEEYFSEHVFFRVLEGNVQDNIISVAWNHYLKGYENHNDGANVGLHEMSHALFIQKMVIESDLTKRFCKQYHNLVCECRMASQLEKDGTKNFYSEYADTDLQEFWAETVELFFERTDELYAHHPAVFDAMCVLMNQDPRTRQNPILKNNLSFQERFEKLTDLMK